MSASPCEAGFHEASEPRRVKRESPRGSRRTGDGDGLRPQPRPERGSTRGLRLSSGAPGERRGLRAEARSERDFGKLRLREVPRKSQKASARASFETGDRRGFGPDASPRRGRGFGRARSAPGSGGGDFGPRPSDPTGIGEGPRGLSRDPPGAERGSPRSGSRRRACGLHGPLAIRSRPARDGLATQRRQSKLGQVGAGGDTGPHSDSRGDACPPPPRRSSSQHPANRQIGARHHFARRLAARTFSTPWKLVPGTNFAARRFRSGFVGAPENGCLAPISLCLGDGRAEVRPVP